MGLISRLYNWVSGTISSSEVNAEFDQVLTLVNGNLDSNNLAADAVGTSDIADGAVTTAKLAADAVTTAKILDVNVTNAKLAADAVTTAKILDANVTNAKLAADAVDKTIINADVAGLGLSQAAGGELDVNVDASTIEINADTLRVKDAGITDTKLASSTTDVSCSVHRNNLNQSISDNLETKIQFTTEEYDTNNDFDTTNYKFTPTVAGKYLLVLSCTFLVASGTGLGMVYIRKNGSTYKKVAETILSTSVQARANGTVLVTANGTDYFEMYVYQDSGSSLNVGGSSSATFFQAVRCPFT